MGTVYSVKFQVSNQEDQKQFTAAFNDIYKLAMALIKSENKKIKDFIIDATGNDDESWLEVDENSVSAWAECGSTGIGRNDADKIPCKIKYDFGKAYPAPPEFLAAFISIICYYFPKAKLSSDIWVQGEEFNDGKLLAALVNPNITKNPQKALVDQEIDEDLAKDNVPKRRSFNFDSVYEALKSELVPKKRLKRKASPQEIEAFIKESAEEIEKLIAEEELLFSFAHKRQKTGKSEDTSASNRYGFYVNPNEKLNAETSATSLPSNKTLTPQQ